MAPEWLKTNLGAVADWSSGGTPSKARADYWSGEVPWVSPKDMKRFQLDDAEDHISQRAVDQGAKLVPPGTVFIVVRGMILAHTFPVCLAGRVMSFNQDVKALIPHSNVDGRFLAHWLRGRADSLLRLTTEATHGTKRIDLRDIQAVPIEVPEIREQQRIAEILDTIDDVIMSTEQVVAKLKQVKLGLLHDLFTRGIDDNGELRDPLRHPKQFAESALGKIPSSWAVGPASQWCSRLTVGVVNSATHAYVDSGIPFIRSQNVKPNRIDRSSMLFVTREFNEQQTKSILRAGDVVIVRTGYPGVAAVVPEDLAGGNCFSLVIASPGPEIEPHFLAQYLNSPQCAAQIQRAHFGSAQHNFNVGEMRRLLVAVPPLSEQQRLLVALRTHEEREGCEERKLAKLRQLKRGLTEDLLSGRVRVSGHSRASRPRESAHNQLGLEL